MSNASISDNVARGIVDSLLQGSDFISFARAMRTPRVLDTRYAFVGNIGVVETTMFGGNLPPNVFVNLGDAVEFVIAGEVTADSINALVKFKVAGGLQFSSGALAHTGAYEVRVKLVMLDATTLKMIGTVIAKAETAQVVVQTIGSINALDFTAVIPWLLTGTSIDSDNDVVAQAMTLTFIPA